MKKMGWKKSGKDLEIYTQKFVRTLYILPVYTVCFFHFVASSIDFKVGFTVISLITDCH